MGLTRRFFKTAGLSVGRGTFAPAASLRMGGFVKIDPDLSRGAPGLLAHGSGL